MLEEARPPSLQMWVDLINNVLPMYKMAYTARGCQKKFDKIWSDWTTTVSEEVEI